MSISRMVTGIVVGLVLIGWLVWPSAPLGVPQQAYAQNGWLIIPGKSWGPVSIGETKDGVLSALGPPMNRNDSTAVMEWRYPTASLLFFPNALGIFVVSRIDVWDPLTVTREGVRVGTWLPEVLRVYGGTAENIGWLDQAFTDCLSISVEHLGGLTLDLLYLARGVGVSLRWVETPPGGFLVTSLSVIGPRPCRLPLGHQPPSGVGAEIRHVRHRQGDPHADVIPIVGEDLCHS